jgi:pantothenate kinase type III
MLRLIIDVGNTNIKFGFFDKKLLFVKILSTKKYSKLALKKMLTLHHLEKIYIGSVVSQITRTMVSDLQALTKVHVHLIKATDFINEFNLTKFNINEIGTDLLSLAL